MGYSRTVAGEDRYQYELREGQLLSNGSRGKAGFTFESVSGKASSKTGAAFGAQLKRNVEEAVLAGQWVACIS